MLFQVKFVFMFLKCIPTSRNVDGFFKILKQLKFKFMFFVLSFKILKYEPGKPKCCPNFFNPPKTHGGLKKIHKTPIKHNRPEPQRQLINPRPETKNKFFIKF